MTEPLIDIEEKKKYKKEFLLNIRNLPSIPSVMLEVSSLLNNPRTSATELGKIISRDQGLVAKVLTVANSPLYGLPRRVSTIEFAIVILGFDHIKNIVIALSMIEAFQNKPEKNWDRKGFWMHSLITASAAKRIADDFHFNKSGEAFTAGLLHDLGISIIHRYFNEDFNKICELVEFQQMRYLNAERNIMGLSHSEVGQLLTERWNLPQSLGEAILFHHTPSEAENKVLSSIIHLADYMTQRLMMGEFKWDDNMEFDDSVITTLKLGDEIKLNQYIESFKNLFEENLTAFENI